LASISATVAAPPDKRWPTLIGMLITLAFVLLGARGLLPLTLRRISTNMGLKPQKKKQRDT